MADFLNAYSVQYWLESAPQGYLVETRFGHAPEEKEPGLVLDDPLLHERRVDQHAVHVLPQRALVGALCAFIDLLDERQKGVAIRQDIGRGKHLTARLSICLGKQRAHHVVTHVQLVDLDPVDTHKQ